MKKLNEIMKELEQFEEGLQQLRKEQDEKRLEVRQLQDEKKRYILDNFGEHRDPQQVKLYDIQIKNADNEISSLEEQILLLEAEKKNKFAPHMEELKKERQKLVEKHNKQVEELELELFKLKLETMKRIEDASQKRQELQNEVNQFSIIGRFTNDRPPQLKNFTIYAPDYLTYGGIKAPIVMTDNEVEKLAHGGNSTNRLPNSYLLFRETGEVVMNETEAQQKLKQLRKGE